MTRAIESAVILAVGSELTTGSTRDTNSGQLAGDLSALGVEVLYLQALPDRLDQVRDAFAAALEYADLVVSTGGLGPTPDDLTREAIAAATGLEVHVDPELARWLRALFSRRRIEMPDANLKQAWLVPGAIGLRNDHGTAPGWWLELPAGQVLVALPGPPREMWPMWQADVRPRLAARGVGVEEAHETLRLAGIGESALVGLIGEYLRRGHDPEVATYSRPDAVDVRVSARGHGAAERVAVVVDELMPTLESYVFARGSQTWPEVIGRLLGKRTLAIVEEGTAGQLQAMLGGEQFVVHGELTTGRRAPAELAEEARRTSLADVGLAVRASPRAGDTHVDVAIAASTGTHVERRTAFLGGPEGQRRAALAACAALWQWLRAESGATPANAG